MPKEVTVYESEFLDSDANLISEIAFLKDKLTLVPCLYKNKARMSITSGTNKHGHCTTLRIYYEEH